MLSREMLYLHRSTPLMNVQCISAFFRQTFLSQAELLPESADIYRNDFTVGAIHPAKNLTENSFDRHRLYDSYAL